MFPTRPLHLGSQILHTYSQLQLKKSIINIVKNDFFNMKNTDGFPIYEMNAQLSL